MVENAAIKLLYIHLDVGSSRVSLGSMISKPDRMLKITRVDNSCTSSVTNTSPLCPHNSVLSILQIRTSFHCVTLANTLSPQTADNVISSICHSTCKATPSVLSDPPAGREKCKKMDVVKPRSRQGPAIICIMRDDCYKNAKYRGQGMCWRCVVVCYTFGRQLLSKHSR